MCSNGNSAEMYFNRIWYFYWWCFFLKASEKSIEKKVIAEQDAFKKGLQAFHWKDYWQYIPVHVLCLEEIIHLAKRKKKGKGRSYGYDNDVWYSAWNVESCKLHNQKQKLLEGSIWYSSMVLHDLSLKVTHFSCTLLNQIGIGCYNDLNSPCVFCLWFGNRLREP